MKLKEFKKFVAEIPPEHDEDELFYVEVGSGQAEDLRYSPETKHDGAAIHDMG